MTKTGVLVALAAMLVSGSVIGWQVRDLQRFEQRSDTICGTSESYQAVALVGWRCKDLGVDQQDTCELVDYVFRVSKKQDRDAMIWSMPAK